MKNCQLTFNHIKTGTMKIIAQFDFRSRMFSCPLKRKAKERRPYSRHFVLLRQSVVSSSAAGKPVEWGIMGYEYSEGAWRWGVGGHSNGTSGQGHWTRRGWVGVHQTDATRGRADLIGYEQCFRWVEIRENEKGRKHMLITVVNANNTDLAAWIKSLCAFPNELFVSKRIRVYGNESVRLGFKSWLLIELNYLFRLVPIAFSLGMPIYAIMYLMKSQLVRSPGQLYCEILTFRLHLEPLSKSLQRVVVAVFL